MGSRPCEYIVAYCLFYFADTSSYISANFSYIFHTFFIHIFFQNSIAKRSWEYLNWSGYLHIFYCKENKGGLIGYKSQRKIVDFFLKMSVDIETADVPVVSDSSYDAWFSGIRKPEATFFTNYLEAFEEDRLTKNLAKHINPINLRTIMINSGINLPISAKPDLFRFSKAAAKQFHALLCGCGEADNIFEAEYKKALPSAGFETYIRKASENWKLMKIFGLDDEWPLKEHFVASDIGTSPSTFPNRNSASVIRNPDLQKLTSFDHRGTTKHVLLIGNCGQGKSIMLQHFFNI